jgi:hypothetical protein
MGQDSQMARIISTTNSIGGDTMPRTPRAKPLDKWKRAPFEEHLPVGPLAPGITRLLDDDGQPFTIDTYIDYLFVLHGRKLRSVWMADGTLCMEEYGVHNILADEKKPHTVPVAAFIWMTYHASPLPPWIIGFAYKDGNPRNCTWDNLVEMVDHERKAQRQQREAEKSRRSAERRKEQVA